MSEFFEWSSPESPISVEYSPRAFEEIRQKAIDGLVAVRRMGLGAGGLLLGNRRGAGGIRILALEEIPCSHAAGPGFHLTAAEVTWLSDRLQQRGVYAVMGMYVTRPRGELELTEQQMAMAEEFFPSDHQVILVLRPGSLEPCRAAFYVHKSAGLERGPEWELLPWRPVMEPEPQFAEDLPAFPIPERVAVPAAPLSTAPLPLPAAQPPKLPALHPGVSSITASMFHDMDAPMTPVGQIRDAAGPGFSPVPITVKFEDPGKKQGGEDLVEAFTPMAPPPFVPRKPELVRAPQPFAGFAPARIQVRFDETPLAPTPVPFLARMMAEIDQSFITPLRRSGKRIAIYVFAMLVLVVVLAGAYLSRPLWVTPPNANLAITEANGRLTFRWNPDAAEFVDAGTLSLLDGNRKKTVALTHSDLMKGFLEYVRNSSRVSASLALDERRFVAVYEDEKAKAVTAPPALNPAATPAAAEPPTKKLPVPASTPKQ